MADDEYEIVPHKEIAELKNEIAKLKGETPPESSQKPGSMLFAITRLNESVNDLLSLFKTASESVKEETGEDYDEKLNIIIDQNKKIAEGIVALADLIKSIRVEAPKLISRPTPPPVTPTFTPKSMPEPFSSPEPAAPSMEAPYPPPGPMPPPFPQTKKGLFR